MLAFEFESCFDDTVETEPQLVFRTLRSQTPVTPITWRPGARGATTTGKQRGEVKWPFSVAAGSRPVFVDLFANTVSVLDGVPLPCRRFLATAVFWWPDDGGRTIDSADMVAGHVKFRLHLASAVATAHNKAAGV